MKFYTPCPLPKPIFQLLSQDDYDKQGDWSVTELIAPAQIVVLKRRYGKDLKQNVMSRVFMVRGNIMHKALAEVKTPGAIIEERFMINILGKQVSMKADYVWPYQENPRRFQLIDMKDPSRYVAKPDINGQWYDKTHWVAPCTREDWEKQVNCYAYGMRQRGFEVDDLVIASFLRDWSWRECHILKTQDYPPHELVIQPVTLWSDEKCKNYLESRVKLMEESLLLKDNELPECTIEDRWAKPGGWAVLTNIESEFNPQSQTVRAVSGGKGFENSDDAHALNDIRNAKKPKKKSFVRFRETESVRCQRGYCSVSAHCSQYQTKIKKDPF